MRQRKNKTPGLEPVRSFPYYKIQVWQNEMGVWKDIQKKFMSLSELHCYATRHINRKVQTRVVIVEDYGLRKIYNGIDAFGGTQ